jgi:hypothetical protein
MLLNYSIKEGDQTIFWIKNDLQQLFPSFPSPAKFRLENRKACFRPFVHWRWDHTSYHFYDKVYRVCIFMGRLSLTVSSPKVEQQYIVDVVDWFRHGLVVEI